jgi:hypothetical protein
LGVDPFRAVADFVQRDGNRGAYAVSGQLVSIAHPVQRAVEGIFAYPLSRVTAMG